MCIVQLASAPSILGGILCIYPIRNNYQRSKDSRGAFFSQVSYAFSSLPTISHGNHLRMVPSERHLADGVVSLLKYFGWKRIVVLSESLPIFTSVSGHVVTMEK